ncbi:tyrosine--tRNA ligase 2, cytoplasmic-like [Neltuma alba]|uniref:tyrosine--tRNA ligase 2, cytoplasmic-like n=1 Tax=Neltuma alba TaxID=207710 RepID=UPI0010A4AE80|nr:tyrosine--tRNA ligase 2, cytoplasmic-like [Prosopis alba]
MESLLISNSDNTESSGSSNPNPTNQLSLDQRFQIVRSVGEECIQEDELLNLLAKKPEPVCYDGLEPSGRMHIAQGVMKTINVNKLTSAGCRVKIWIDDWFAKLNNKMGGDLKKIEEVGRYFIEIWKAAGMDIDGGKVEFVWASKEINARAGDYWPLALEIAPKNKINDETGHRQIMGRSEQDELTGAQIFYPCMQCAGVFILKADICQMGTDQRKVSELTTKYCDDVKEKNKPIILSHYMLPSLQKGREKMSKSDPSSSIFMDDEEAEVNLKIKKAYCPPKIVEGNPCLEYIKNLIIPSFNEFLVERSAKNGGNKTFKSFEELIADYESGGLHPADLKPALAKSLNRLLEPVREHFKKDKYAKDILKRVKVSLNFHGVVIYTQFLSVLHRLSLEQRFQIVRSVGEECIQEDELLNLLAGKHEPVCYDGFEPSGRMHVAQGVMKTINVNKLTSAGCRVKIWIADWFAKLNNKMGGDLKKIEVVGRYLIEIWKAVGMDIDGGKVDFIWASKEINARAHEYWPLVWNIAQKNNVKRLIRCSQIMGRSEKDELTVGQIIYPCMQCADVFFLKADVCQMGTDQRKVNVLAREHCDHIKRKNKPIILSHHMLPGLQQGQEKMSKSDPSSSIFMDDEEAEVNLKIEKAHCPPKIVEGNPCLEYIKYLIMPQFSEFLVERSAENGGNKTFKRFEDLIADYESGELHPADLKPALAKLLNRILEPVREHFKKDSNARDLLEKVKAYRVTR